MGEVDSAQRLGWFESVMRAPAPIGTRRPLSSRPPALDSDPELDLLEEALARLVEADNVAEERRSLLQSLEIVDRWKRSAREQGENLEPQRLSDLAYRLVAWKRGN